jgi:leucyl-tRNA synthetase
MADVEPSAELTKLLHKTIKKVTHDTDTLNFNTAISQMMIFLNEISRLEQIPRKLWEPFVLLLSPYAPHLGEELWEKLCLSKSGATRGSGGNGEAGRGIGAGGPAFKGPSVSKAHWPAYDEALTLDEEKEIVVQVNGKIRDKLVLPAGSAEDVLREKALASAKVQEWTAGKTIAKLIVVRDKLVNIVVKA